MLDKNLAEFCSSSLSKLREEKEKRRDAEKRKHAPIQLKELKAKRAKLLKEKEEEIDHLNETIREPLNKIA